MICTLDSTYDVIAFFILGIPRQIYRMFHNWPPKSIPNTQCFAVSGHRKAIDLLAFFQFRIALIHLVARLKFDILNQFFFKQNVTKVFFVILLPQHGLPMFTLN